MVHAGIRKHLTQAATTSNETRSLIPQYEQGPKEEGDTEVHSSALIVVIVQLLTVLTETPIMTSRRCGGCKWLESTCALL